MKTGPKFEKDVAALLTGLTPYEVERRVQGGARDRGDLSGIPGWVHELKSEARIVLGSTMNEAQKEARNAGVDHWAAVHKRRSHHLERSYVTVELWEHARLLRAEAWARVHGWDG